MKLLNIFLCTSLLLSLTGCLSGSVINKHFEIYTDDISDHSALVYKGDDDRMFTVIDAKVFAYQKCGFKLFVKQHPLTKEGGVDTSTTNYYIVDLAKDYTQEVSRPFDTSIENFNRELSQSGSDGQFITF